jgi:hypothetical protein
MILSPVSSIIKPIADRFLTQYFRTFFWTRLKSLNQQIESRPIAFMCSFVEWIASIKTITLEALDRRRRTTVGHGLMSAIHCTVLVTNYNQISRAYLIRICIQCSEIQAPRCPYTRLCCCQRETEWVSVRESESNKGMRGTAGSCEIAGACDAVGHVVGHVW